MTIDEAIIHAEEVMMKNLEKTKDRNASDPIAINCFECADEHRQLAEWLKDYKRLLGAIDAIKAEIQEHDMWVQYSIKGHTDKDIQDTVSDVIKQSKKQVLAIIDRHISGGDAE